MRLPFKQTIILSVALLILSGFPCYGVAGAAPDVADTGKPPATAGDPSEKLLEVSGLKTQLQGMDASTVVDKSQLEFLGLSREELEIVGNLYAKAFRSENYYRDFLGTFAKGLNNTYLANVTQWFLSPLGRRIIQAETVSQAMDTTQKSEKTAAQLSSDSLLGERLVLIERLERAMDLTRMSINLLQSQLRTYLPLGFEFKKGAAENFLMELKGKSWVQPLHERTLLSLLHTYGSLSDEELTAFAGFAESASGQWFYHLKKKALVEAQGRLGELVADQISVFLKIVRSGKGDSKKAVRDVMPVGTRYLFTKNRDPFIPLSSTKKEMANINFSRVMSERAASERAAIEKAVIEKSKKPEKIKPPRFGDELKALGPIPLEIYNRLKERNPALYNDLEKYGFLFKDKTQLSAISDKEYQEAVADYRGLINKTNKMSEEIILSTPLQTAYGSLKLAGVVWKKKEPMVLIETGDNLGFSAQKGTLIGPNYGIIEAINQDKVIVVERKRDFEGNILSNAKELGFSNPTRPNNQ